MASTPSVNDSARIGLINTLNDRGKASAIWVYDWNLVVGKKASSTQVSNQIVVLKNEGRSIGLLVDDIHDVKEFEASQILPSPFGRSDGKSLLHRMIRANKGELLIQAVNLDELFSCI
jgi:chemotaxis signal transduction protein